MQLVAFGYIHRPHYFFTSHMATPFWPNLVLEKYSRSTICINRLLLSNSKGIAISMSTSTLPDINGSDYSSGVVQSFHLRFKTKSGKPNTKQQIHNRSETSLQIQHAGDFALSASNTPGRTMISSLFYFFPLITFGYLNSYLV